VRLNNPGGHPNGYSAASLFGCGSDGTNSLRRRPLASGIGAINSLLDDTVGRPQCEQSYSSRHVGGTQFLLDDGAVRFISENVQSDNDYTDPKEDFVFQNLLNKSDGNVPQVASFFRIAQVGNPTRQRGAEYGSSVFRR